LTNPAGTTTARETAKLECVENFSECYDHAAAYQDYSDAVEIFAGALAGSRTGGITGRVAPTAPKETVARTTSGLVRGEVRNGNVYGDVVVLSGGTVNGDVFGDVVMSGGATI